MLPLILETVIMPFKGKIVYAALPLFHSFLDRFLCSLLTLCECSYDGLLSHTPIQIGSTLAKTWAKSYLAAKQSKKVRQGGARCCAQQQQQRQHDDDNAEVQTGLGSPFPTNNR
jgi:hypothetical protein